MLPREFPAGRGEAKPEVVDRSFPGVWSARLSPSLEQYVERGHVQEGAVSRGCGGVQDVAELALSPLEKGEG